MMVSARDLASQPSADVSSETTVDDALQTLLSIGANELYVTDKDGLLAGVVTDYDLLKAQLTCTVKTQCVAGVMSRCPACVEIDEPVAAVAGMFREARHAQMAVVEQGRLVGVIGRRDVMRLIRSCAEMGLDLDCGADMSPIDAANAMRGPRYVQNRLLMAERSPSLRL